MSSRIQSRSQRIVCDFGHRCFVFVAYKTCIFFVECFLDVFVCWFVVVSMNRQRESLDSGHYETHLLNGHCSLPLRVTWMPNQHLRDKSESWSARLSLDLCQDSCDHSPFL